MKVIALSVNGDDALREKAISYARNDVVRNSLFLGFLYPPLNSEGEIFVVVSDRDNVTGMGLIYWDRHGPYVSVTGEGKSEVLRLIVDKMTASFIAFGEREDVSLYEHIGEVIVEVQYHMVLRDEQVIYTRSIDMPIVRVTQKHLHDLNRFYQIHEVHSWNPKMLEAGPYFCVVHNDKIIGAVGIHFMTPEVGHFGSLFIEEGYRHRGLATSLTSRIIDYIYDGIRIISCSVFKENLASVRMFQKLGFRVEREKLFLKINF